MKFPKSSQKLARQVRRVAKAKFKEQFENIGKIIKPKPKWMPVFIWQWLVRRVISIKHYDRTRSST